MAELARMQNEARLRRAIKELGRRDPAIGRVEAEAGKLQFHRRPSGFASLVRILVGQQLSTTAATAIFARLEVASGAVAPAFFLTARPEDLRTIGLSAQKMRTCRALAEAIASGALDLAGLAALPDEICIERLTALPGIGDWTARIYLLFALGRPDVWPAGDVGLHAAYHRLAGLAARPSVAELTAIAEAWRPWRSVAARLLWHYYDRMRTPV
jgi:DNA-3-methyladenine glycosylase II